MRKEYTRVRKLTLGGERTMPQGGSMCFYCVFVGCFDALFD